MSDQTADIPRYFALDLAEQFIVDMHEGVDDDERERIQGTILCAGQHLADCGEPGAWQTFDPISFLPKMPAASEWEQIGICLDLVGLFGWMGMNGLIDPLECAAILTKLGTVAPEHPILTNLLRNGVKMCATLGALDDDDLDIVVSENRARYADRRNRSH